jgi:hypothetical protein
VDAREVDGHAALTVGTDDYVPLRFQPDLENRARFKTCLFVEAAQSMKGVLEKIHRQLVIGHIAALLFTGAFEPVRQLALASIHPSIPQGERRPASISLCFSVHGEVSNHERKGSLSVHGEFSDSPLSTFT